MREDGVHPALMTAGVLRDVLDDVCDNMETLFACLDGHQWRLESNKGRTSLSESDARSVMTLLGSDRLAAWTAAITEAQKLDMFASPGGADESLQKVRGDIEILKVRDHMHKALDGVVP